MVTAVPLLKVENSFLDKVIQKYMLYHLKKFRRDSFSAKTANPGTI